MTPRREVSRSCGENGADRLAQQKVTTNLQFVFFSLKHVKRNKMRYAYDIQVNKERCEYSLGYEGK